MKEFWKKIVGTFDMEKSWWKIVGVISLVYSLIGGLLFKVPRLNIVNETVRGLYFHVPMWFAMIFLFSVSTVYAIKYLRNPSIHNDTFSSEFGHAGLVFGMLGIFT